MNKFLFAQCICLITILGFSANQEPQQHEGEPPSSYIQRQIPKVAPPLQVPQQSQIQPQVPGKSPPSQELVQPQQNQECARLTPEEQAFARRLSGIHRSIFCGQFSGVKRAETMTLVLESEQYKKDGAPFSPDMAVEQVIKHSREVKVAPKMKSKITRKKCKPSEPSVQYHRQCGPMDRPGTGLN